MWVIGIEQETVLLVAFRDAVEDLESQTDYSYDDLRDVIDQMEEDGAQ